MTKILKIPYNNFNYLDLWSDNKKWNILILHWWGWSSDSWVEIWKSLKKEWFRVIIPNLPWSRDIDLKKAFTIDECAILIERLLKVLEIKKIILLWHSNWWAISMKLSERWKIKISKLLLNNSAWIRKDIKRTFKRKVLNNLSKIWKETVTNLTKRDWITKEITLKARKLFYRAIWGQDYLKSEGNPYLKETYINMINSDLQKNMKNIFDETVLIWWEEDSYTPLSDAKKINKLIKWSKLIVLDKERHWIHLQNPKRLVKILLENI